MLYKVYVDRRIVSNHTKNEFWCVNQDASIELASVDSSVEMLVYFILIFVMSFLILTFRKQALI